MSRRHPHSKAVPRGTVFGVSNQFGQISHSPLCQHPLPVPGNTLAKAKLFEQKSPSPVKHFDTKVPTPHQSPFDSNVVNSGGFSIYLPAPAIHNDQLQTKMQAESNIPTKSSFTQRQTESFPLHSETEFTYAGISKAYPDSKNTKEIELKKEDIKDFENPYKEITVSPTKFRDEPLTPTQQKSESILNCSWGWLDPSYVKLPISTSYTKAKSLGIKSLSVTKWEIIRVELTKLKSIIDYDKNTPNIGDLVQATIGTYNPQFKAKNLDMNFHVLNHPQLRNDLMETIPSIVDFALTLDKRIVAPVPVLTAGQSKTIYVDQRFACIVLANAFFCTFPNNPIGIPEINFFTLFCGKAEKVKLEKLKCILNYFKRMKTRNPKDNHLISFERRVHTETINWEDSENELSQVTVDSEGKIEQQKTMLQVDFAYKLIGGEILREKMAQEQIRFTISPELILSRLFTEALQDNEVLVITGCEQFSKYSGYMSTFKYEGNYIDSTKIDENGRREAEVVAMDALLFKKSDKFRQYEKSFINRELLKCYTAFQVENPPVRYKKVKPIATGNWGCGKLGGDFELKFLIQLLAASKNNSRPLYFYTFGDTKQKEAIENIVKFLHEQKVNVGLLYDIISFYGELFNADLPDIPSVFEAVEFCVKENK